VSRPTYVLLAIVAWGALALGAVAPWAYWPLAAACLAYGTWALREASRRGRRPPRMLTWTLGLVALAILVQLVPWPYGWFARASPAADRLLADSNTAFSLMPPAWHALSIAPRSTANAFGLFVSLAVLLLGLSVTIDRIRLDRLATALAIFSVALTLFGVVQLMIEKENASVIYFVYPTQSGALPFGPFINKNHFAGWMVMALPLVFGYVCALAQASWRAQGGRLGRWLRWLTRPEAGRLILMSVAVVIMGTSIVLTKSRSGIGAFAIVLLVLTAIVAGRATRHLGRVLVAAAMIGLLIAAVQLAGSGETVSHFARSSQDLPGRLQAWRDAMRIIRDFSWFGTGLGTFWMAMLVYQTGPRDQIFFQAHNDYLQLAAEGGLLIVIPALIALVVLAALALRSFNRREDLLARWLRAGAIAGLVGIAAQSALEFSLQMPGVTVLCVMLLALAIHRSEERGLHARRM